MDVVDPRAFRDGIFSQAAPLERYQGSVNSYSDGSLGNARRRLGIGTTQSRKRNLALGLALAATIGIYVALERWS